MPEAILHNLTTIAGEWRALAIVWHAGAALVLAVLILQAATQQLVAVPLTLPVFSVAALAWWAGNPFNGAVFAATGAVLLLLAIRLPYLPVAVPNRGQVAVGALLCVFAWVYPHFLSGAWSEYLYQSPLGLIPCPTLSFVVGVTLITYSFQSSAWALVVASISLLYGVTGVFVLGVGIDWVLVAGAAFFAVESSIRLVRAPDVDVLEKYRRTL